MELLDLLKSNSSSFKSKYVILKRLKISRRNFSKNNEQKKLFSKVYRAYLLNCIFLNSDSFCLKFKGVYIDSLNKRILDWFKYCGEHVYGCYLRIYPPKHPKPYHSRLIFRCIYKPVHQKLPRPPDKTVLEHLLSVNRLIITDEFIESSDTIYHVTIKK